ncbi:MAG: hypothetical protein LC790_13645, partial [Actinobacteria bacterium]|nr:hypothetical protein [Actinomycetota bacterium]
YYAEHQRHWAELHAAAAAPYAEHRPHADATFGRRRSDGAPARGAGEEISPVAELLRLPFRATRRCD